MIGLYSKIFGIHKEVVGVNSCWSEKFTVIFKYNLFLLGNY